jgi:hypothetical protein
MKLIVKGTTDIEQVELSLVKDEDGDVDLLANGIKILYIDSHHGKVVMYNHALNGNPEALEELGFVLRDGEVVVL